MVKRPSKESQQKALKREAYRLNISVSELKRLKSAGDGQERTSPLPHGDNILSHESYEAVSQQDAPPGAQEAASQEAVWPEAATREAAAQENGELAVTAPPVITVVPGQEAVLQEAAAQAPPVITVVPGAQASQEAASREAAVRAPPVITVVPGGHEAASREAAVREAVARAPPVITVVPGGHEATSREAASREAAA